MGRVTRIGRRPTMIEKRYKDIDADWYLLIESVAREQFSRYFVDVESVLESIAAGDTVQTPHALYRLAAENEETDGD